jgi:hypothetical protein
MKSDQFWIAAFTTVLLHLSVCHLSAGEDEKQTSRNWTDILGRTIEAALVSQEKDRVTLSNEGKEYTLPIARLSEEDRAYLRQQKVSDDAALTQQKVSDDAALAQQKVRDDAALAQQKVFAGTLFAPQIQQQKKKGNGVCVCTTRVIIKEPVSDGSKPVVMVRFLLECRKKTQQTQIGFKGTTITERTYAGYMIASGQAPLEKAAQKGLSELVEVSLAPSGGIDFARFEQTISQSQNVVGYYVKLLHNGKIVDSKLWEKLGSVDLLKKDYNLSENWWRW